MRPSRIARLALVMALFFAAGHLLYAAALYTAKNDPVKTERVETARQAMPFALDILLVLGVYFTGLLAASFKKVPSIVSRKRQYTILCFALLLFLALMIWRTGQNPAVPLILRRHVFMAVVFALLGLYNKRHFALTKEEEAEYEK
ncbi:hypothetical protein J6U76_06680 [bacterium]|nr:hypothetical protein [bacterium]